MPAENSAAIRPKKAISHGGGSAKDVIEEILAEEIVDETDWYADNVTKQPASARRVTTAAVMQGIVEYRCDSGSDSRSLSTGERTPLFGHGGARTPLIVSGATNLKGRDSKRRMLNRNLLNSEPRKQPGRLKALSNIGKKIPLPLAEEQRMKTKGMADLGKCSHYVIGYASHCEADEVVWLRSHANWKATQNNPLQVAAVLAYMLRPRLHIDGVCAPPWPRSGVRSPVESERESEPESHNYNASCSVRLLTLTVP
ncbi:hypothetical protein GGX14DRAFT_407525 [Mycena pura]|uniref:Uncharacterized protein n=1 Tax=Mycena pura TaxID=153505 RepID=A0AAD6XYN3_9AGAR|nr:hypothetical protein GGX14DRAFT_407525 [Mycena pura]